MEEKISQAIKLYLEGLTIAKASKSAGIGSCTLQKQLKIKNLTRSNKINSRRFIINENYFEKIDTEEKAYWLGFIYADGYLSFSKNRKYIGIALSTIDELHLNKFLIATNSTYQIKQYENKSKWSTKKSKYSRVLISCDKMFDDLKNHGVLLHKSLILEFPTWLNKKFQKHFIRGYFDGDGSFAKATRGFTIKICGTKEFLHSINKIIKENPALSKRKKDTKNNFYITIGGMKKVKKIANYMYGNCCVSLDRKHERFNLIMNF